MYTGQTVRELELEMQVRDLKQKLMYYRSLERTDTTFVADTNDDINISWPPPLTMKLSAVWQCSLTTEGRYCVVGKGYNSNTQEFGIAYYVDEKMVYEAISILPLLGHLHEKMICQLADTFHKQRGEIK